MRRMRSMLEAGVRTTYSGALTVSGISTASAQPSAERELASRVKGGCGR